MVQNAWYSDESGIQVFGWLLHSDPCCISGFKYFNYQVVFDELFITGDGTFTK